MSEVRGREVREIWGCCCDKFGAFMCTFCMYTAHTCMWCAHVISMIMEDDIACSRHICIHLFSEWRTRVPILSLFSRA